MTRVYTVIFQPIARVREMATGPSSSVLALLKEINSKVNRIEQQQGILQRSIAELKAMQQERDIQNYCIKGTRYQVARVSGLYSNSTQYLCTCSSKDSIYYSIYLTLMLACRNNWRGTLQMPLQ